MENISNSMSPEFNSLLLGFNASNEFIPLMVVYTTEGLESLALLSWECILCWE